MIKRFEVKKLLAWMFDVLCLNRLMHHSQVKLLSPFIRAVCYHDVPPSEAAGFEQQLRYFVVHFSPVSYDDLVQFRNNRWENRKPGLIITFDDGHRSSFEVVAPLLQKYGFTGWFFISPALIDVPADDQPQKAVEHRLVPKPFDYGTSRVFLSWDQIRELDRVHTIGCHTLSHCRLRPTLSERELHQEIVTSKHLLEERLGHEVLAFAWVGGEETSYSREAANMIRMANYKVVFLTNNSVIKPNTDLRILDRTHMDSSFSPALMRFQLSGVLDVMYAPKRKRVNSIIMN